MSQSEPHYRPDIDGLRAIAVGAVLAFHAFPALLPGGFVGVDVFFVISGYLISGIILTALAGRRFTFSAFYARRIRRIFPALALLLAALLVAGWMLLYADDYARLGYHAAAGAGFISNLALWRESSYFDVAAELKPLLHLWSLGVEEQFYFVWPLLLVLAARWRRGPIAMTFAIGAISFVLAIWTVRIDRTAAFYAPWNRFWELLGGAALACVEADAAMRSWLRDVVSRGWVSHLSALTGALLVAAGVVLINQSRAFPGVWVMLPVAGTFLLLAAGPHAWLNRIVLSSRVLVFVGLISYPLYLWHWPLLSMTHIVHAAPLTAAERLELLAISAILATGTYYLVELPIRVGAWRHHAVAGLAVAMSVVGAGSWVVMAKEGFIDRPVNRGDAAAFVDYYDRMHKDTLGTAYREECDFLDWKLHRVRTEVAPSCLERGAAHTVFLWGDSHAQALSLGIRENLPPGTSLAQVATSACRAQIDDFETSVEDNRCEIANRFAMDAIHRLRPDLVILAQEWGHGDNDWKAIIERVRSLGGNKVLIVGPVPAWWPTLPRVYAEHHLQHRDAYVADGLDLERFTSDRQAAARVQGLPGVTYLSLLEQLCRDGACLARVSDDRSAVDLISVDAGHLSPKGSSYLGQVIWKPLLASLLR